MSRGDDEQESQKLGPRERAEIFKYLDKRAGLIARLFAVFEPPVSERDAPLTVAQWRFGIALLLLGIFFLGFCFFLPNDARRWMFVAMACLVVLVGVWFADRANKKLRSTTTQKSN